MTERVKKAREQVERLEWFLSKARQSLLQAQEAVRQEEQAHAGAQRELAAAMQEEIELARNQK